MPPVFGGILKIKWVCFMASCLISSFIIAQEKFYFGVYDKSSGEALPFASIKELGSNNYTFTNDLGLAYLTSFEAPQVIVSYLGYKTKIIETTHDTLNYNIYLIKEENALDQIEIISHTQKSKFNRNNISFESIPIDLVTQLPSMSGERDLLRYLQNFPGVNFGNEGQSNFSVRGGNEYQNGFFLDNAPIYNPTHMLGFVSNFNSNIIKNVDFYKNSFPPEYTGRLSSVIDIYLKEGNKKEFESNITLSPISIGAELSFPISKDNTSLLLAGRKSIFNYYLKVLQKHNAFLNNSIGNLANSFHDANIKLHHKFNKTTSLSFQYFASGDQYVRIDNIRKQSEAEVTRAIQWKNDVVSSTYKKVWNRSLSQKTTMFYTRYAYNSFNEAISINKSKEIVSSERKFLTSLQDYGIRSKFKYYLNRRHITFGSNLVIHRFKPLAISSNYKWKNTITQSYTTILNTVQNSYDYDIFFKYAFNLAKKFNTQLGLVHNLYYSDKLFWYIQPRLSVSYEITESSILNLSLDRNVQTSLLLDVGESGIPTQAWVPATADLPPQDSWQTSLGYKYTLKKFRLYSDIYYKKLSNMLYVKTGQFLIGRNLLSNILIGSGNAYGMETKVEYSDTHKFVSLSYAYQRSQRMFPNLNSDRYFPFTYERPHSLSASFIYHFSTRYKFSIQYNLTSGRPISLPVLISGEEDFRVNYYEGINNQRLSTYSRLDCGITYRSKNKKNKFSFNIYNILNNKNAYYFNISPDFVDNSDGTRSGKLTLEEYALFPIIPSFSYSYLINP